MNAAQVAQLGRALAESLMTSRCTIFTSGEQVTDPQTGEVTTGQNVVWSGPCRVRPTDSQGQTAEVAGAETFTFDFYVSVPFAVTGVLEGHRLTITDSPDPALAGMTLEVQRVARGDNVTARRLSCTEVL